MLCIDNSFTDIYFNLATEEYLLKNFRDDVFMLWQSNPSVVIGKYQHVENEVNLNCTDQYDIKVARRMTGGGAVYHDLGNLNLTYIEQNSSGNYEKFTTQLASFLKESIPEIHTDNRNNIFIQDKKISGSAQCVHNNKSLHHCTLLFSSDTEILNTVLHTEISEKTSIKTVKSIHSPVANIKDYLSPALDLQEFKANIMQFFQNLHVQNKIYTLTECDLEAINQLCNEKYSSVGWIFKW